MEINKSLSKFLRQYGNWFPNFLDPRMEVISDKKVHLLQDLISIEEFDNNILHMATENYKKSKYSKLNLTRHSFNQREKISK
jgi:hypothetical protein